MICIKDAPGTSISPASRSRRMMSPSYGAWISVNASCFWRSSRDFSATTIWPADSAIAAFERPGPAVDVALALQAAIDADPTTTGLGVRVAVHRGPMMALTQGGRLDYFGSNVELALSLSSIVPPFLVGVTQAVAAELEVSERLENIEQLGMHPIPGGSWVLQLKPSRGTARLLPSGNSATPVD